MTAHQSVYLPNQIKVNLLQYAVVKKIHNHRALYIFDDVGTGKTIQAGLAIYFTLKENVAKKLRVLIITAPSVKEQFNLELILKFGLTTTLNVNEQPSDDANMIKVIHCHYTNLEKQLPILWDLIIIDEAHFFVNSDTKRTRVLSQLKSHKVMFMTATPIRNDYLDMDIYPHLAAFILGLDSEEKSRHEVLFRSVLGEWDYKYDIPGMLGLDVQSPVSRNFKEVFEIIEKEVDSSVPDKPRQRIPEIWGYDNETQKINVLIRKMKELAQQDPENRFVIFCRQIKRVHQLHKVLQDSGVTCEYLTGSDIDLSERSRRFREWSKTRKQNQTASEEDRLPQVLILSSGIGEVGLNLPGYNYVVNYDIPITPAALEQRFGRIDRYNNQYEKLTIVFLLPESNYFNRDLQNYHVCFFKFIYDVTPDIPSKNNILTEETARRFLSVENESKTYRQFALKALEEQNEMFLKACIDLYQMCLREEGAIYTEESDIEAPVLNFTGDSDRDYYISMLFFSRTDDMEGQVAFEPFIGMLKRVLASNSTDILDKVRSTLAKSYLYSGNIFYKKRTNQPLGRWESEVVFCSPTKVSEAIKTSSYFSSLKSECMKAIEIQRRVEDFAKEFNDWCEQQFIQNTMHLIFDAQTALQNDESNRMIHQLCERFALNAYQIKDSLRIIFDKMPFGQMTAGFKANIENLISTKRENLIKIRQDGILSWDSLRGLYVKQSWNPYGLTVKGTSIQIPLITDEEKENYYVKANHPKVYMVHLKKDSNGSYQVIASAWLKMLYYAAQSQFINLLLTDEGRIPRNFAHTSIFFIEESDTDFRVQKFHAGSYWDSAKYWLNHALKGKYGTFDSETTKTILRIIRDALNNC